MQLKKNLSTVVVKVGSSLISSKDNAIRVGYLDSIVCQIEKLFSENKKVVLVSSGAIACGMSLLNIKKRPKDIASLQAAAAIGQSKLMEIYQKLLSRTNRLCAQILLTWEDFEDRTRYLNVKHTILRLLDRGILPIVNENDTVSTDEIRFGDNDKLSSLVATLVDSDLLVILSDVEGLYRLPKKELIKVVDEITPEINRLCSATQKEVCVGGMSSKIEAIKIAVNSGIPAIIASGTDKDALIRIASGESVGTFFMAKEDRLKARKRWLAYGVRPKGAIIVDNGAKDALVQRRKSLLAVGIAGIKGDFKENETVSIIDYQDNEFARGKVNFSSKALTSHKGTQLKREVIHRDDLVIL